MLINDSHKLKDIFELVQEEMKRAVNDKKHPFRYLIFSSLGAKVRSRYVVLRSYQSDNSFVVYTDSRSSKVEEIRQNPEVHLLFYNSRKQVQVLVEGICDTENNPAIRQSLWLKVQGNAQKSYNTTLPPGAVITTPETGHQVKAEMDDEYFEVLNIQPVKIEVLQLNRSKHLRASFYKENNWEGSWLVP